jgi:hypothetical protein
MVLARRQFVSKLKTALPVTIDGEHEWTNQSRCAVSSTRPSPLQAMAPLLVRIGKRWTGYTCHVLSVGNIQHFHSLTHSDAHYQTQAFLRYLAEQISIIRPLPTTGLS